MRQRRMIALTNPHPSVAPAWVLVRAVGLAGLMVAVASCSGDLGLDSDPGRPDVLGQERSGAASGDVNTWTSWHMPLSVCFTQPAVGQSGHMSDATFTSRADGYFAVLVSTWGRVPGVSFNKDCVASERLNILLSDDVATSQCGLSGCVIYGLSDNVFVHETGHGLGLAHEHQRSDHGPYCAGEQAYVDKLQRCHTADVAGQPCTADDYNGIFYPNPPATTPQYLTQSNRDFLQWSLDNNLPDSSYTLLTLYDPQSIMNYCSAEFGRLPEDSAPTALDLLGVAMLYPQSNGSPLGCGKGCFKTSTGVIVRTDGVVMSDWMARGAISVPISLTTTPGGSTLPASALPSGTATITHYNWDPRSVRRSGTAVTQKSNSVHAALVSSVMVL